MIQDGWGYGRSSFWEYNAKIIIRDQKEECDHLSEIFVNIMYDAKLENNINFDVRCDKCHAEFTKTRDILTKKFLQFYGK